MDVHPLRTVDRQTIDRARSFHAALATRGARALLDWYAQGRPGGLPPADQRPEILAAAGLGTSEAVIGELLAIIDRLTTP